MKRLLFLLILCVVFCSCRQPSTLDGLKSRYVTEDGVRIHYKTFGHGTKAVVFIHGLGCDINTWEAQYESFSNEPNLRLVFIDLPGYGASDKPAQADYTLTYFADAIEEVLDEEDIHHALLVGHSLGTPICRQFYFEHPCKVSALVDIDGVYVLLPADSAAAAEYQAAMQAFAAGFCQPDVREYFQGFVTALSGPETPAAIIEYASSTMPNTQPYVACSTMSNLISPAYWTGETIACPTTVICTQNSGIEPDNCDRMQALYPRLANYVELTTCGHFIHMEQPDVVNSEIRKLLQMMK